MVESLTHDLLRAFSVTGRRWPSGVRGMRRRVAGAARGRSRGRRCRLPENLEPRALRLRSTSSSIARSIGIRTTPWFLSTHAVVVQDVAFLPCAADAARPARRSSPAAPIGRRSSPALASRHRFHRPRIGRVAREGAPEHVDHAEHREDPPDDQRENRDPRDAGQADVGGLVVQDLTSWPPWPP